ncbi:MAG: flagellin [Rickettsiales bacterium]|nr:flagellin [Rickettsiales bacterium]
MAINGLFGVAATPATQDIQRASSKLQAVIQSLVSGNQATTDNVEELSIAARLQSSVSALRSVSTNLAQASSLAQVADGGAKQILDILVSLKTAAERAGSPTLNTEDRIQQNNQFQQLLQQVDKIARNVNFGGQSLLDGSLSNQNAISLDNILVSDGASNSDDAETLSIANLTSSALFNSSLNVLTSDNAVAAFAEISEAITQVTQARTNIGSFQRSIDYASATFDSALFNQQAVLSTLFDTDVTGASTQFSLESLVQDVSTALAAQGNRLPPTLLRLIS